MPNPYLQDQANQISQNLTQNLQNNVLPGINSGAIAAGGFGGSRQGVAQANAIGQNQQAIGNAQTNLFSNAYNTDQQIQAQQAMQRAQLEAQERINNANLGLGYTQTLGNLGLGYNTANQNFYTAQRGQDLQQLGLGAQLAGQGNLGLSNQGQQLWGLGQQQQNAPQQSLAWYQQMLSPFTGLNQSQTQQTPGGSTLGGAIGGGLTIAQILKLMGG